VLIFTTPVLYLLHQNSSKKVPPQRPPFFRPHIGRRVKKIVSHGVLCRSCAPRDHASVICGLIVCQTCSQMPPKCRLCPMTYRDGVYQCNPKPSGFIGGLCAAIAIMIGKSYRVRTHGKSENVRSVRVHAVQRKEGAVGGGLHVGQVRCFAVFPREGTEEGRGGRDTTQGRAQGSGGRSKA